MSKVKVTSRFTHRGLNASGSCSSERGRIGRGNLLLHCGHVAVTSAGAVGSPARGPSAPTKEERARAGHIVAAARLQLVSCETSCAGGRHNVTLTIHVL